jgi:DNA gyrase/topoisomerase IV subunit B
MGGRGRIRVEVSTADGSCLVAFRDDGPGIPTDVRDKDVHPILHHEIPQLRAGIAGREAVDRGANICHELNQISGHRAPD